MLDNVDECLSWSDVLQGYHVVIIYPRRPELPAADKVPVHFSALPEYILDDMADFLLFIVQ